MRRVTELDTDVIDAWAFRAAPPALADPPAGPLAGYAFGVKDTIDVAGMPTGLGLARPAPTAVLDAWCVAALRAAGAYPLGKTRSTPLAFRDPAPTINPRHPDRTPGGSSAGSAAAVAAEHVPFALGTQTLGSVVRPAAYCGVVGFKPTYGAIAVAGVHPLAPSFDTVGVIARDVAVATAAARALLPVDPAAGVERWPLRLAYAPATLAERFAPETLAVLDAWVARIPPKIASVTRVSIDAAAPMIAPTETITAFEAHALLHRRRDELALPPQIAALLERGARIGYAAYREALALRERLRAEACDAIREFDALLVPLVDEAPTRESTGDGIPQGIWTAWGFPALTLPVATGSSGLCLSIGIVAPRDADARVLAVAARLETL
jgi:Asp-tRNA(Asn)/Glu-tRNA(Gln) amidotransferase A subunit family amidase